MDMLSALAGAGLTMLVLFVVWRGRYAKDELDHLMISSFSILTLLAGGLACSTRPSGSLATYVAGATAGAFVFYAIAFGFAIRRWRRKTQERASYSLGGYGANRDDLYNDASVIQRPVRATRNPVVISTAKSKTKG